MRRVIYLFINDFRRTISAHRRLFLAIIPYLLIGLTIGAIIASNLKESDYVLGFAVIFTNEYSPFKTFFILFAILAIYLFFVYFCSQNKFWAILMRFVGVYLGYVLGRIIALTLINNLIWGICSTIVFIVPSMIVIVFSVFYALGKTYDRLLCGINPIKNPHVFKPCLSALIGGGIILFIIHIIIGGIINTAVNIIV